MNVGVLVSGSGTNLQALIDAERAGELGPARLKVVISNVAGAKALERAQAAGIPSLVLLHREHATREEYDQALTAELKARQVELVALAGFMRLVSARLLDAFPERVLNIHPSLLPAFPGLHAQRQALVHGVKVSGCTVHLVDRALDAGPILGQTAVPVLDDDDEATLRERILAEEHRLYPRVLRAVAERRVELDGRRARIRERAA
jgi:phosphoribosylglycinamide formyltransferase-1